MTFRGIPLAPGRAGGETHLVDDPLDWGGLPDSEVVIVLPAVWWPAPAEDLVGVRAVVLEGSPLVGGTPPGMPVIAGFDRDLFREGERMEVDGDRGELTLQGISEHPVVTAFLRRDDGKILLLRRSGRVGSFQGRWAAVSGFLEDPTPIAQAYREISEETGIGRNELSLEVEGRTVYARSGQEVYIVHPFLFRVGTTDVRIDWEHTAFEWVDPSEIRSRATVPKLDRAWDAVGAGSAPKG
ncbi:MAG: NUDIX domain-containing protein [Thermoplasmata archaeon]|nr:NUDIX pyrophosphatase [Thermoplasmata archaeon]